MTTRESITELAEQKFYESKRIRLTSPLLHIGGDTSPLSPIEYIQDQKFIYVPNQDLLANVLRGKTATKKVNPFARPEKEQTTQASQKLYLGLLNDYVQAIREQDTEKVKTILQQALGKEWQNATDFEGNEIFPQRSRVPKWTDKTVEKLRPMIRDGFGNLYIPGSSIKGAIRTAIAYYLLQHPEDCQLPQSLQPSQIEFALREKLGKIKDQEREKRVSQNDKKERLSGRDYMKGLFSNFILTYQGREFPCESESNSDFMRAIQISDSDPLPKIGQDRNVPVIAEVITSSFTTYGNQRIAKYAGNKKYSTYVEMLWNVETEFSLGIDTMMLNWFENKQGIQLPLKLKTVKGLVEICEEFAQAQWKHEHRYWNSFIDNSSDPALDFSSIREMYSRKCDCSLRLGWGSGMTGTTVDLQLEESTRASIRNACGTSTNSSEAPKSRRTAIIPTRISPTKKVLGWVKFKAL